MGWTCWYSVMVDRPQLSYSSRNNFSIKFQHTSVCVFVRALIILSLLLGSCFLIG